MARKAGQLISRGSRTWLVRVSLGRDPETGIRRYHNKTIRGSFREAQTYLNGKLQEREIGRLPRAAAISLNQYLDQWLTTAAKPRLRPKSYTDYEALLRLHIRAVLGTRPLGAIVQFDIQIIYARMFERGLSARTIEYTNAVLQSAFRQAVRWKMLGRGSLRWCGSATDEAARDGGPKRRGVQAVSPGRERDGMVRVVRFGVDHRNEAERISGTQVGRHRLAARRSECISDHPAFENRLVV